MISMSELLKSYHLEDQPSETQKNLEILLEKVNKIRVAWGKSMTVTSGLRSMEDHLRIYRAKGITDPAKIPMRSHHLYGEAVDISDPDRALQKWCKDNEDTLSSVGLWMEDFSKTPSWCHFQIVPPKSGHRWFLP